jgi:CheY-like chemotaxis protein
MTYQAQISEPEHILVMDDHQANLQDLEMILKFKYRVSLARSDQMCLDQLEGDPPDLILLNVNMPMTDGLTLCRMIKANSATSMIPVIFVSSLSRLSERLASYKAGADDYVTKPYNVEALLCKIRIALNNRHDLEMATKHMTLVQQEMEESLAVSTELGELARFIGESLDCDDLRALGEQMLVAFERFGLRVIVRMIPSGHYFSHAGEIGALDREMMESMYEVGEAIDFGRRTLINMEFVTVLVRNMPIHDLGRYRRWKENLKLLVRIVSRRISDDKRLHDKQGERERLEPLIAGIWQLIERLQNPEQELIYNETHYQVNRLLMNWESQQH